MKNFFKYDKYSQTLNKNYLKAKQKEQNLLTKKEARKLEAELEQWFIVRCHECNLVAMKMNPQTCKGIPDRLVFDPAGGRCQPQFVELKRNSKAKASPLQVSLARGLNTKFIHSKEEVEELLWMYFTPCYVKHENKAK